MVYLSRMRILVGVMAVTLSACQSEHQYGGFHDLQTSQSSLEEIFVDLVHGGGK